MWHSKVSRQTFPVDLLGVTLGESCKLMTGWSEGIGLFGKSSLIFSRQIESVRRHQLGKHFRQMSGTQSLFHPFGTPRDHTVRQDIHDLVAQFFILGGIGQTLLAGLLEQADCVNRIWAHVPPSQ